LIYELVIYRFYTSTNLTKSKKEREAERKKGKRIKEDARKEKNSPFVLMYSNQLY